MITLSHSHSHKPFYCIFWDSKPELLETRISWRLWSAGDFGPRTLSPWPLGAILWNSPANLTLNPLEIVRRSKALRQQIPLLFIVLCKLQRRLQLHNIITEWHSSLWHRWHPAHFTEEETEVPWGRFASGCQNQRQTQVCWYSLALPMTLWSFSLPTEEEAKLWPRISFFSLQSEVSTDSAGSLRSATEPTLPLTSQKYFPSMNSLDHRGPTFLYSLWPFSDLKTTVGSARGSVLRYPEHQ